MNEQSGGRDTINPPTLHKPKHPAYRVWLDVPAEVRAAKLQAVIARVINDEKLADIAKDLGLSRSALNMALLEYSQEDWQKAQVARAVTELEQAQDERESAPDMLTLVRARDREKSAQWKLERLMRRLFGQDAPAQSQAVQININLRRADLQRQDPDTLVVDHNL